MHKANYSNIRVLVIDDEPAVQESLTAFLENYGFRAAACGSAKEARDLMKEEPFDVCLVDINLPGLSGEDLILLAHQRYPDQRYIIHTGDLSFNLSPELSAIGMRREHIFRKPITVLNLLVKCIKELVDAREATAV